MKSTRNFNLKWKSLFINEETTSAQRMKPGNFYKIMSYTYADGKNKSLSGPLLSYIFLLGKYLRGKDHYIAAIKLKYVEPKHFFNDIKLALKVNPTSVEKIDEVFSNLEGPKNDEFSKLLKKIQTDGKNIFSIIKNKKRIYEGYREYIFKNIKTVAYLDIDSNYLKLTLTKESKKSSALKQERKMTNTRNAAVAKEANEPKNIEK